MSQSQRAQHNASYAASVLRELLDSVDKPDPKGLSMVFTSQVGGDSSPCVYVGRCGEEVDFEHYLAFAAQAAQQMLLSCLPKFKEPKPGHIALELISAFTAGIQMAHLRGDEDAPPEKPIGSN